jgi:hypothetical protein
VASLVTRDPEYAFSNFSYREGEADAQLVWHASWLEVQPIMQAVFAVAFKVVVVPADVVVGGEGTTQLV